MCGGIPSRTSFRSKIPPSGCILLNELEKKGYEIDGKYILTIRSFGVPTTVLYFLLVDCLNKINEFQNSLNDGIDNTLFSVSSDLLPHELELNASYIPIISWDKQTSKSIDHNQTASGSTAIGMSEWYFPNQQEYKTPLNEMYFSKSSNLEIGRDYIKKTSSIKENDKYLITVFKDILNFFESAYALKDRMESEFKSFSNLIGVPFKLEIPKALNSICYKRGSIIHESNFDFDIASDNQLKFGNQKIGTYLKKGIDEAENWINETYLNMVDELNKH